MTTPLVRASIHKAPNTLCDRWRHYRPRSARAANWAAAGGSPGALSLIVTEWVRAARPRLLAGRPDLAAGMGSRQSACRSSWWSRQVVAQFDQVVVRVAQVAADDRPAGA